MYPLTKNILPISQRNRGGSILLQKQETADSIDNSPIQQLINQIQLEINKSAPKVETFTKVASRSFSISPFKQFQSRKDSGHIDILKALNQNLKTVIEDNVKNQLQSVEKIQISTPQDQYYLTKRLRLTQSSLDKMQQSTTQRIELSSFQSKCKQQRIDENKHQKQNSKISASKSQEPNVHLKKFQKSQERKITFELQRRTKRTKVNNSPIKQFSHRQSNPYLKVNPQKERYSIREHKKILLQNTKSQEKENYDSQYDIISNKKIQILQSIKCLDGQIMQMMYEDQNTEGPKLRSIKSAGIKTTQIANKKSSIKEFIK